MPSQRILDVDQIDPGCRGCVGITGQTRDRSTSDPSLAFWLTHLQPETHCPIVLSRSVFEQLAVDLPHLSNLGDLIHRREQIRAEWDAFRIRSTKECVVIKNTFPDTTRSPHSSIHGCQRDRLQLHGVCSFFTLPSRRLLLS